MHEAEISVTASMRQGQIARLAAPGSRKSREAAWLSWTMQESRLLRRIRETSVSQGERVLVGPGDDCAVVRTPGDLLVTVDHLIEGRHYHTGETPERIAYKAIARSISDIAAMGGRPLWALATGALPTGTDNAWAEALFDEMHRVAKGFGAPLVGGDLASLPAGAPVVLTVTVAGEPGAGGAVLRSGARVGDEVWVTGRIGGSLVSGRHMVFTPRVAEGLALAGVLGARLHAMIDLSDGLGRDAGRIAAMSGVRIEIDGAQVPLHEERCGAVLLAAGDGEDYELLFAVEAGSDVAGALRDGAGVMAQATMIGRVVAGQGCVISDEAGVWHEAGEMGWEHGEC